MIQEMYAEIQRQTDKHSVSELCSIYGVSRSGYYKWLKRAGQLNQYEKTHEILDQYVLDIHSHHPMMGYRQIRDKLRLEFGWIISDPTVWKSMKRLGIHGYTRHRKTPVTGSNLEHIRYSNVLNRKFKAEQPMRKIVTDVTTSNITASGIILRAIWICSTTRFWNGNSAILLTISSL